MHHPFVGLAFALLLVPIAASCTMTKSDVTPVDGGAFGDSSLPIDPFDASSLKDGPASDASLSDQGAPDDGGLTSSIPACAPPAAASGAAVEGCGEGPGQPHPVSVSSFIAFAARRWILCDAHGWSGLANEAGFDLHADGSVDFLSNVDAGDSSTILTGTMSVLPNSGNAVQLDIQTDAGTYTGISTLTDSPRMLVINDEGMILHYVPADVGGWPDDGGAQGGGGHATTPLTACSVPLGAPHVLAGTVSSLIVGTWLLCSQDGVGTSTRKDVAGFDVQADGNVNVLVWDAANRLTIASDVNSHGRWSTVDGGPAQIDFAMDNGSTWLLASQFYDSPLTWMVTTSPSQPFRYVAQTAACVAQGDAGLTAADGATNPPPDSGITLLDSGGNPLPLDASVGDAGPLPDGSVACTPADTSGYKPRWTPPSAPQVSCTKVQLDSYGNCLDSNDPKSAQCAPWLGVTADPANAICAKCIAPSKGTDPAWGPLVDIASLLQINVAGCLALTIPDQTGTGCAGAFAALSGCESFACGSNCASASQSALDVCVQTADTTGGCSTYETNAACVNDASAEAQACFGPATGTFGKLFAAVAAPFCAGGGGDASTDDAAGE